MEDSEMDMVIPLQLNIRKKTLPTETEPETADTSGLIATESHSSHQEQQSAVESSPSKSTVLGPTQAKKRLLAFAQQWGKTKENLEADKCLEKHTSKHGTLKYTFIVRDEFGKKTISFPARLISYTLTEPALSYSPNPRYASGAYQSKKEVLDSCSQEEKQIMYFIMNSTSPSCQSKEFPGRYRKWYASRNSFVGKPEEEEEDEKYSPHWESSDDELDQYLPPSSQLFSTINPLTTSDSPSKVVSKVKINKVELPFFEDDDFLDSLMAKVSSSSRREKKQEPSSDPSAVPSGRGTAVSTSSTFDGSFEGFENNRELGKSKKRQSPLDWEYDERHSSASFRRTPRTPEEKRKRRSSPKSFKEESERRRRSSFSPRLDQNETGRRSSSRLSSTPRKEESERRRNSFSPRINQNETGRRSSSRLSSTPHKEEDERDKESTPVKEEGESFWKFALEEPVNMFGSRNNETAIPFLEEPLPPGCGDEEEENEEESESKRLSLDQRLELELGIKIDAETSRNASFATGMLTSPMSTGQRSTDDTPAKRRTGFGPKAAPIATLIFQCPKALPAQPYIPPHLQNRLCRPLTRVVPSSEELGKEKDKKEEDDPLLDVKEGDSEPRRKNWDKELKHLEALASNLEVADDAIWRELEEKLLLFEMANIFAPSGPDSPREEETADAGNPDSTKEIDSNHVKERSSPSPIELKEPGKGILVMPRISLLLDEAGACLKKSVLFADSVRPGCGTSSEEDDAPPPVRSPPQSTLSAIPTSTDKSKSKLKRRKKQKFTGPDYDPVYDLMPPPPPPPGSPPPHLPQGRNSPLASVDDLASPTSLTIPHSPCPVEPGPC